MNRKEAHVKGHTYVVSRRFLDKATGKMRVRVQIFEGLLARKDALVHDQFKDFDNMHDGDTCFAKQVKWLLSLYSA